MTRAAAQAPAGASTPPLSRDAIADAGLAVLERDGFDGLSMRKVAAELGVRAASLYWHVRDKQELLDLLADALLRDLDLTSASGDWREQIANAARCYRRALLRQRDAIRVLAGRFVIGPNYAKALEWTLSTLRAAGFGKGDAAHALYLVMVAYTQGFVSQESAPMTAAEASGASPQETMAAIAAEIRALPAETYPCVTDSADILTKLNLDDRFEFGLTRILDGLALRLADQAARPCDQPDGASDG